MNKSLKVCFPSTGESMDSVIDSRFGRCSHFLIVELKSGKILGYKSVKNIGSSQGGGAGINAVGQIDKLGVKVLITEEVGPKSKSILDQLGIKIIKDSGIIKEALQRYLNNN